MMPGINPILQSQGFPTLFGDTKDKNATFVIDTSENMQVHLNAVKCHLIEALLVKAHSTNHNLFNIVQFSNKVIKWCDRMVTCSPQSLYSAIQWIQSLTCSLGRDLLSALMNAFDDPGCHAIFLVTNGRPDNKLKDFYLAIPCVSRGRPIHVLYLSGKWIDDKTRELLQEIARLTRGSVHLIALTSAGDIKLVIPIYPSDPSTSGPLYSSMKYCSVKTALDKIPYYSSLAEWCDPRAFPMFPVQTFNVHSPKSTLPLRTGVSDCAELLEGGFGPSGMFWGGSVLARRDSDGLYYRGKVQQELGGRLFLIEFDKQTIDSRGKCQFSVQKTALHNIIQYTEGMRHSVVPGDKVIAPWEPDLTRYGPGTVIFGIETRDPLQAMDDEGITVNFWNGKTVKLSKNVAMWIPPALHARIIQELSTPLAARQQLCIEELCTGYDVCMCRPYVLPVHVNHFGQCSAMHTASQAFPFLESSSNYWYGFYCGFHCAPTHPPCHCLSRAAFDEGYRPPTPRSTLNAAEFDQGEVEKKCASQLEELDVPKKKISGENSTSSSSSSEDSVNDQKKTAIATCTLEDRAVNTDISLLKRPKSTMKEQPEWQYWRQSYPEPNHKKPGGLSSGPVKSTCHPTHVISSEQKQHPRPVNRRSMFENVEYWPSQSRTTMREILTCQEPIITTSPGVQAQGQEHLGENQVSCKCQQQKPLQQPRERKQQHHQRGREREEKGNRKHHNAQEQRRQKTLQRLQDDFQKAAEREYELIERHRAKQHSQLKTKDGIQSISSEDRGREVHRPAHLQAVTARWESMEGQKVKSDEIKEIQQQEDRKKQMEERSRETVGKFREAEKLTPERDSEKRKCKT